MVLTVMLLVSAVDPLTLLQIVLAGSAVIALGGVGFQGGRLTSLRGQLADADREIKGLKEREVEKTATIKQQQAEITALQRTVTGEAYLVALDKLLREHNEKAEAHWAREEEMYARLVQLFGTGKGPVT